MESESVDKDFFHMKEIRFFSSLTALYCNLFILDK